MSMPRLSLVTTNFNYGRFLDATLRSVLEQNYPDLEFIVIDGGSTDDSVAVIQRYASQLAYWESTPDSGQAHALNKGLRRCTGDIVGFLNSDDLHLPDTLARVAEMFANPTTAWIGGPSEVVNAAGAFQNIAPVSPPADVVQWIAGMRFPQPSSFWRTELLRHHGCFEEHLYYCFDQEYWARLAVAGHRPLVAERPLSRERAHPAQKTATMPARYLHERLFIAHKFLNQLSPRDARRLRSIVRTHERTLLREPLYREEPHVSLRRLGNVLACHPDLLRDRQTWGLLKQALFSGRRPS